MRRPIEPSSHFARFFRLLPCDGAAAASSARLKNARAFFACDRSFRTTSRNTLARSKGNRDRKVMPKHGFMEIVPRIAVVVGSNRPRRICPEIAEWVRSTAATDSTLAFETIDLREVALPFLDETEMAALGVYEHEHTRSWSRLVSSYDGFVFVFPQYNWGYPAVLKNALDFLYAEWRDKPAGLVTYGSRGGVRAAAQLQVVLQGLHMRNTATNPALTTNGSQLRDNAFIDIAAAFEPFVEQVGAMAAELAALIAEPLPYTHD
jgi:NAD(P)H-dependent FMN reductase